MSHLAAAFPGLSLGSCVLVVPWYNPLRLAEEISALKKELKAKSSGGADPRVDKILEILKNERSFANDARKAGL